MLLALLCRQQPLVLTNAIPSSYLLVSRFVQVKWCTANQTDSIQLIVEVWPGTPLPRLPDQASKVHTPRSLTRPGFQSLVQKASDTILLIKGWYETPCLISKILSNLMG
ncbi:hypothetical protein BJP37_13295 [Moorena bouillonii PNG]|uniref:Uncharacterized protein n=1 Tax=Moorena bouillonii PNG TaxID=568701 RepID=A0A1U7N1P3_9CYAN|nr:hypothetical protein BJP37_13295 [Moorena bouillonii PNG]